MNFSETELTILSNFAKINPSQIINPTGFGAKEPAASIIGTYDFEEVYDFEPFGIYEVPMFLQALEAFNKPKMEVKADRVIIKEGGSKIQFFTTPLDLIKNSEVPNLAPKFDKLACELDFDLPADKLATIIKTSAVFKARYLFLESSEDGVRLTVSSDTPGSSANSFDIVIRDNVRTNELGSTVLKIPFSELRIIQGDYSIKASSKKISKWSCFNDVTYYVGCMID